MGSGGKTTTTQTTSNTPWAPQAAQLEYMLAEARRLYDQQKAEGPTYTGPLYVGMDEATKRGLAIAEGAVPGMLQSAAQMGQVGATQLAGGANFGTNAANFAQGNFGPAGSVSPLGALTEAALAQYGLQGMGAQGQAISTAQEAAARAGSDRTDAILSAAGRYSSNPYLDAAIEAANRDVVRQLSEETLPTLNRLASAGGNLNSSRAGAAEAIAVRGAADRMADIAAAMRQDAYKTGLGIASDLDKFGTQALLASSEQLGSLAGQGAAAGSALAGLLESRRGTNIDAMLEGNKQAGQALEVGQNLIGNATQQALNAGQTLANVGVARQQEAQAQLEDYIQQLNARRNFDWNLLSTFSQFAADDAMKGYGTNVTTTTAKGGGNNVGGWLQTALGVAALVAAPFTGGATLAAAAPLLTSGISSLSGGNKMPLSAK